MLLLRHSTLASAFRLKPSVLPVATRHFLTTSSNPSPSQVQQEKVQQKKAVKVEAKPRITKKDITPPFKRPTSFFVAFVQDKLKNDKNADPSKSLKESLRQYAAVWKTLSEKERLSYAAPPEAIAEYQASYKKWYDGLSIEVKKALKIRRRRKYASSYGLFASESYKDAKGNTMQEKSRDLAATWKALSTEKKEEYGKRARETLFGVRAERVAVLERAALAKKKAAEKLKAKKAESATKVAAARKKKLATKKLAEQRKWEVEKRKQLAAKTKQEKKMREAEKKKQEAEKAKRVALKMREAEKKKQEAEKAKREVEKLKQAAAKAKSRKVKTTKA